MVQVGSIKRRGKQSRPNGVCLGKGTKDTITFDMTASEVQEDEAIAVIWRSMIYRCYSGREKFASYMGCEVSEDWLLFSNFKTWVLTKDWAGKELDKDLIIKGNRVYSPETCCFLDYKVNLFLTEHQWKRGQYPLGVCKKRDGCAAYINIDGKTTYLGTYEDPQDAHKAWKYAKHQLACSVFSKYETDADVIQLLKERWEDDFTSVRDSVKDKISSVVNLNTIEWMKLGSEEWKL